MIGGYNLKSVEVATVLGSRHAIAICIFMICTAASMGGGVNGRGVRLRFCNSGLGLRYTPHI